MLTSTSNSLIKHIKKLQTKKSYRHECGEFVIEGVRQVFDAADMCKTVLVSENFDALLPHFPCAVETVSAHIMESVSETKNPQGILAVAKISTVSEENLIKENGLYIFCDNVQDPGNLGTIIRTADAAGADGVILGNGCADLFNPKTVRSTMSSLFNVPICVSEDSKKTFEYFKACGVKIFGSTPHTDLLIYEEDFTGPSMLVLGNEANGICDELLTMCDACVKIPMVGSAESLNVATAGAVLIYEALRQKISYRR